MKNTDTLFLILGLGICAAMLLIDRFVVSIPDWLAIIFILLALVSFFIGLTQLRKKAKKRKK